MRTFIEIPRLVVVPCTVMPDMYICLFDQRRFGVVVTSRQLPARRTRDTIAATSYD